MLGEIDSNAPGAMRDKGGRNKEDQAMTSKVWGCRKTEDGRESKDNTGWGKKEETKQEMQEWNTDQRNGGSDKVGHHVKACKRVERISNLVNAHASTQQHRIAFRPRCRDT